MEQKEFEDTLRMFIRQEPFLPFVVELEKGESIVVAQPTLAFNDGFAGYLSSTDELFEFSCEEVRSVHLLTREVISTNEGTP